MNKPAAVLYNIKPVSGLGSLTTADEYDFKRWQRGEFTWADRIWCRTHIRTTLLGAAYNPGRMKMHPLVPKVDLASAQAWPCIPAKQQAIANAKAEAFGGKGSKEDQSLPPSVLPPLDPIKEEQEKQEQQRSLTQTKIALAAVVLGGLGFVAYRRSRRKKRR
jgi:hypothetical protein